MPQRPMTSYPSEMASATMYDAVLVKQRPNSFTSRLTGKVTLCGILGCFFAMYTGQRRRRMKRMYPLKDRKSTRLNSSHVKISYAVFCLKKKKNLLLI